MARKLTVEEKIDRILATCEGPASRAKAAARIVAYAIAEFMADRIEVIVADTAADTTPGEVWEEVDHDLAAIPNTRPGQFRERVTNGYGGSYERAGAVLRTLQDRIDASGPLVPTRAEPTNLDDAIRRAFGIHVDDNEGGG